LPRILKSKRNLSKSFTPWLGDREAYGRRYSESPLYRDGYQGIDADSIPRFEALDAAPSRAARFGGYRVAAGTNIFIFQSLTQRRCALLFRSRTSLIQSAARRPRSARKNFRGLLIFRLEAVREFAWELPSRCWSHAAACHDSAEIPPPTCRRPRRQAGRICNLAASKRHPCTVHRR